MSVIDNIIDFCKRRSRPSYLLPKPKPPSRKEIEATRKAWAERDQRRKELEESKAYLSYEIPYPVYLEDYINIDTDDWVEPNPVLYQIIVPLSQEFYYKDRKWRFTDEQWKKLGGIRGCAKIAERVYTKNDPHKFNNADRSWMETLSDGLTKDYRPTELNLDEVKTNITNIRTYNETKISTLRCYAEAVEFHLAMGSEGVFEELNNRLIQSYTPTDHA